MSVLVKVLLNVHHHFVLYVVRDEKMRDSRKCLCKLDSRSKPALVILFILFVVLGSSPRLTHARQMLGAALYTSPGFSYLA